MEDPEAQREGLNQPGSFAHALSWALPVIVAAAALFVLLGGDLQLAGQTAPILMFLLAILLWTRWKR